MPGGITVEAVEVGEVVEVVEVEEVVVVMAEEGREVEVEGMGKAGLWVRVEGKDEDP